MDFEDYFIFEQMDTGSIAITQKTYSLFEVMQSVQAVLQKNYVNRMFWVRCELSRISLHAQSGHCYLELIDKNESSIVAQMRGIIWSDRYTIVSEKFKAVTNSPLSGGMKLLLQCSVNFHPVHGLSLSITDIEPSFTLGEMARMKNDSIRRLKKEGLFNLNRELKLALLPKRIAIISVSTSRGYQDFISTIIDHTNKYSINIHLFDAILQGENAVPTIVRAINKILADKNKYDAIAIIRGGAGDAGLACYDEYSLAATIAGSSLPVITGIGHATNETVVEMVAYKNCITPTAAAMFILEKFDDQLDFLNVQAGILNEFIKSYFTDEKKNLMSQSEKFCYIVSNHINRQDFQLKNLLAGLPANLSRFYSIQKNLLQGEAIKTGTASMQIQNNKKTITHISEKITLLDPVNTLKRGYSITRINGKALTETSGIAAGMKLETELAKGKIISTVEKKN